ncbi:MAG: autorepressor SdpR family transcription factor [Firmicutes bacterium]|nr:autorepressor SdpR family transcription factor [Bacillota bacterium]
MAGSTFKALADPTRRKILRLLRERDLTAGEIAEHFAISKPSISHHLGILKNANLVLDERKGQFIYYSLNMTVFQELVGWFNGLIGLKGEEEEYERKDRFK